MQAKDQSVPLDELEVGVGIDKDQVRQLRQELVQKRPESLEQDAPNRPVDVTVLNPRVANRSMPCLFVLSGPTWFFSPTEAPKAVINGQHTVKALLELRRRWIKAEKPLPYWLRVVNVKELKPEIPMHCRQLFVWDKLFRQSQLKQQRLSDLATDLISRTDVTDMQQDYRCLGLALRNLGSSGKRPRYASPLHQSPPSSESLAHNPSLVFSKCHLFVPARCPCKSS